MRPLGCHDMPAHRQCLRANMQLPAARCLASRAPLAARDHASRENLLGCRARAASGGEGVKAIVLVDHGSKRAEANEMLDQFADLYRASTQRQLVRTAHMELARPTIAEAIAECAELGASTVVVAPFFLSRGRHITEDIPALVEAAAAEHPDVHCVVAAPLGTDALLAQLLDKRVQEAIADTQTQH